MKGADALVLITEWNQFRRLDLQRVKDLLAETVFFDLRNVYEPEEVISFSYINWKNVKNVLTTTNKCIIIKLTR